MNYYKHVLYFSIGFLSALSATEGAITWRSLTASLVAGLIAIKALGSNPNKEEKE